MQALRIVLTTVGMVVLYGVVHDQIAARLSLEYLTVGHRRLFAHDSPTLHGLAWGVIGTWWARTRARTSARGRASIASRYCGNVSQLHWMPSASAEPGMSSTLSISEISQSRRSGRAGAKPTPQLPITSVVTPCQHEGVR